MSFLSPRDPLKRSWFLLVLAGMNEVALGWAGFVILLMCLAVKVGATVRKSDAGEGGESPVRALAAVGVRHVVVSLPAPYDVAMLRTFAKDVMPALRDRQA